MGGAASQAGLEILRTGKVLIPASVGLAGDDEGDTLGRELLDVPDGGGGDN
jgi:hypothetical protein